MPNLRRAHHFGDAQFPNELLETIDAIRSGIFGDHSVFEPLIATLFEGKDFCKFSCSSKGLGRSAG